MAKFITRGNPSYLFFFLLRSKLSTARNIFFLSSMHTMKQWVIHKHLPHYFFHQPKGLYWIYSVNFCVDVLAVKTIFFWFGSHLCHHFDLVWFLVIKISESLVNGCISAPQPYVYMITANTLNQMFSWIIWQPFWMPSWIFISTLWGYPKNFMNFIFFRNS